MQAVKERQSAAAPIARSREVIFYSERYRCAGAGSTPPEQSESAGIIALRPEGDGTISGYSGLDDIQQRFGDLIIDAHLPPAGTPTQPVDAGYMANAWVRARHEDFDHLRHVLDEVGKTVTVHVG